MAVKPSTTAAEKALQKIQDRVSCGICLEPYTRPKLLKCFHVFCENCLKALVRGRQSITCPQCRQDTALQADGVLGLQGAFYIHYLFEIQDALQKVSSSDQPMCNKCKKREAVGFCRTCGFVCQRCEETHQEWDDLSTHEIIDLDTLTGDVTTLVPPLKKTLFCSEHPTKEADLYCNQCDELICRDCIVRVHRDHQYNLVPESFTKQEGAIIASLKPVEQQLAMLHQAIESLNVRCTAVEEQKTAVVADIHTVITQLQQALEVKKKVLVAQAEQTAQQKLKILAAQRDAFELQIAQRQSCQGFVKETRRTCSQGEILRMKGPLVKRINDLTGSFKPETLALVEQADLKFAHSLQQLMKTCQQFGKVYCHPACPEKCRASGDGIKVAMRGREAVLTVEALDREGEVCLKPVDNLVCELVTSDGSSQVRGAVKNRAQNRYEITYRPQHIGRYKLHILVDDHPILNSPFTVTLLPNLTAPATMIRNFNTPFGIAVREGGELVVAERDGNCVSMISATGEKKSFGTEGSTDGKFYCPEGAAIDAGKNILVVDCGNHRIQQFSPTGKHLNTVGSKGSGPLQFQCPVGIAVHPHTQRVYVTDAGNNRIQVLNSDLTYASTFGSNGSDSGKFSLPYDISTDSVGRVYVADRNNHRVQVFTADGEYLRQFGKPGAGEGELDQPVSITVDSHNIVYIGERGNNRVSVFSTDGKFIKPFGSAGNGPVQFNGPYGIASDKTGSVYVCDSRNNCVQIFS